MMMFVAPLLAAATFGFDENPVDPVFNRWFCARNAEEMVKVELSNDTFRVNNIFVSIKGNSFVGAKMVELSATITNPSDKAFPVAVEVIGFAGDGEHSPYAFAIGATPTWGRIDINASEQIKASVLAYDNLSISKICARVSFLFPNE